VGAAEVPAVASGGPARCAATETEGERTRFCFERWMRDGSRSRYFGESQHVHNNSYRSVEANLDGKSSIKRFKSFLLTWMGWDCGDRFSFVEFRCLIVRLELSVLAQPRIDN
jgi:hypothetical protein